MNRRLAIGASGFALFGLAASLPALVIVRLAIAGLAAICLVGALMPGYALRFLRANAGLMCQLIASIALTAFAMVLAQRHLPRGWQATSAMVLVAALEIAYVLIHPVFRRWVLFLTIDQWRAIDAETERAPGDAGAASWKVLAVLLVCAVSLTLQEYLGDRGAFERWFPPQGARDKYFELKSFGWWSGWRVLGYAIIPLVTVVLMRGERVRDYNMSLRGFTDHLWIYVLLFVLITPAVIVASTTDAFRHTYPFYRMANRSHVDLWTWEAFYAAQFVSLEVFFRGFLLAGLRRALGANAIFVMIVPYCMIHYGKPLPETLGAIGAGVILGTLAMRTKSIWGGVLIHIGVATMMDVLALRGCPTFGSDRYCGS